MDRRNALLAFVAQQLKGSSRERSHVLSLNQLHPEQRMVAERVSGPLLVLAVPAAARRAP